MLEKLISEHAEQAYGYACRLTGDTQEAKELVQEAFFRVMRNFEDFDRSQPFSNWLMTILRHIHMDAQRSFERRNIISLDIPLESEEGTHGDSLQDGQDDVLERMTREDAAEKVRRVLDRLPNEYRGVLHLCDVQGLGYEEIAKVMECSVGTVKSRLSRARVELRKQVQAEYPDLVEA